MFGYDPPSFDGIAITVTPFAAPGRLTPYNGGYLVRDMATMRRIIARADSDRAYARLRAHFWDALEPKLAADDEAARLSWFWGRPVLPDDDADEAEWLVGDLRDRRAGTAEAIADLAQLADRDTPTEMAEMLERLQQGSAARELADLTEIVANYWRRP